jgi:hypothetical protein
VLSDPGQDVPFQEGFESESTLGTNWVVRDPDEDATFTISNAAQFTGNGSIWLSNSPSAIGRKDDLVSTTFDMSTASSIRITYRYAFAQRNASNDDRLRVYVSKDCGSTWSLRQQLRGSTTLASAGVVNGTFVPSELDQWGYSELDNISAAYHTSSFRVRFEFESNGGNDLYLDDININGQPVGIGSIDRTTELLSIHPNPNSGPAYLEFQMAQAGDLRLEIVDALGRSAVPTTIVGNWPSGPQRIELPVQTLAPGTYILLAHMPDAVRSARFVVQ